MSNARINKQNFCNILIRTLPFLIIAAFFVLNVFTPLLADDFNYSFVFGTGDRLSSISDIFVSQYHHFMVWGGRSVAHFFAQLFLFIGSKYIFDICNTIMYSCLILLIHFHVTGTSKKINALLFFTINVLLWFFVPAWGQNFLWLTGSCNYLWTTVILLFFLMFYRKKNDNPDYTPCVPISLCLFPLGVLAGWTNENSSAAVLFLLIAYIVMKFIQKEKFCLFEILGIIGFVIGFAFLILAPGNYSRLNAIENTTTVHTSLIIKLLMRFISITMMLINSHTFMLVVFSIWLGFDILHHQKKKLGLFTWFYFLAGIASIYSMLLSPDFPERAFLIVVVFFCIIALSLLTKIKILLPGIIKRNMPLLIICFSIYFSVSFLTASKNIIGVYLKWHERTNYITAQRETGKMDIEVKAPIPAPNNHTSLYGLTDVEDDKDNWANTSIAQYFGIHSIKRLNIKDPW